jgi:hypothetical protein
MQPGEARVAVSPESLLTHGCTVEAIAGDIEVARVAAASVRLDRQAYGILCASVPFVLNKLSDDLMVGLRAATESLQGTGGQLATLAYEFARAEAEAQPELYGDQ